MPEQKDWEKIEKLIRLANNNPNENEANLAARKACQMLGNVKFHTKNKNASRPGTSTRTWEDVVRRPEPFWTGGNDWKNEPPNWEERDRKAREEKARAEKFNEERRKEEEARKQKVNAYQVFYDDFLKDVNWEELIGKKINYSKVKEEPFYRREGKADPKIELICTKCGHPASTRYKGKPENFICNVCQLRDIK